MVNDKDYVNEKLETDEPWDVLAERQKTYGDNNSLLRIYNLKKTYKGTDGAPDHTGRLFSFLVS